MEKLNLKDILESGDFKNKLLYSLVDYKEDIKLLQSIFSDVKYHEVLIDLFETYIQVIKENEELVDKMLN